MGDFVMTNGTLYVGGSSLNDSGSLSAIWKYNMIIGDSYLEDRKPVLLFHNQDFGLGDVTFSVIEGNLYLGEQKSSSILKVLNDGTIRIQKKTSQPPRNFMITPREHYFYAMYWQPARGQYAEADNYDYFNGIKDYTAVPQTGYASATLSIADGQTDVFNGDLSTISDDFKDLTYSWHDPVEGGMKFELSLNTALYKK